jgi:hypothetical protein
MPLEAMRFRGGGAAFGDFAPVEKDVLRLKADVLELEELKIDSRCVEGDPLLVLGLVEVGVLFPPNMLPPLKRPPPFECEAVERCISASGPVPKSH